MTKAEWIRLVVQVFGTVTEELPDKIVTYEYKK